MKNKVIVATTKAAKKRVGTKADVTRTKRRRISGPAYTIDAEGRTRDVYSGELLDL